MRYWWKILAVLLISYAFIQGLSTPLSPAIVQADKIEENKDLLVLAVKGYNASYGEAMSVWLRNGANEICGSVTQVEDKNNFKVRFDIGGPLSAASSDLIVSDPSGVWLMTRAVSHSGEFDPGSSYTSPCPRKEMSVPQQGGFPTLPILYETIRNLFFPVPMWFSMMFIMLVSVVQSILYLRKEDPRNDRRAVDAVNTGLLFGILGLVTGSIWARFTWGAWWTPDPQLNAAATTMLIYFAYIVLRNSIEDDQKRARISAIYNIFAFAMLVVLIGVLPKMIDSLHPGKKGSPGFNTYDLDNALRAIFYPAVLGWILITYWLYTLRVRSSDIEAELDAVD